MQNAQAFQGQEGFYHVHLVGFAGHELAETAGGHYEGLAAQFFFHPADQSVHLAHETENHAGPHGVDGIPADGLGV